MKSFEQFLNEEADIKKSGGVPSDFTQKSEEQARRGLGVRPDDERGEMPRIWPEFDQNMRQSNQLLRTGPNGSQLSQADTQQRINQLEDLAKRVVLEEFGDILRASVKPIELDIKLVAQGGVARELPDITQVSQRPEMPQLPQQQEDEDEEENVGERDAEESDEEGQKQNPGQEIINAIDKKKILNMITQAAGKSAKDIIRYSELVESELARIFGRTSEQILQCWVRMSDLADKMDWVIPVDRKSEMMKRMPGGMAGACQVVWESQSGNYYQMSLLLEKEATKIVIKAVGIDFPMLIHETIKGIYLFLQSGAVKKDKETAKLIKKATSSFQDEAQDFRYGPPALEMLLKFVNNFPQSGDYSRLDSRVFAVLAYDKDRAKQEAQTAGELAKKARQKADSSVNQDDIFAAEDAEFNAEYLEKRAEISKTDKQFIDIMKSLFSTFDLQGSEFVLDQSKFNQSLAKTEIEAIIQYIVEDIEEYETEVREWEQYQKDLKDREKYKSEEEEQELSDVDRLVKQSLYGGEEAQEVEEKSYDQMTIAEIQREIEKAIEQENYELAGELTNKYLKGESKKVWKNELKRINESRRYRGK
jgi:hypothetical protein